MCCFSVADVFLEDPPPEKKEEEKKEDKVNKKYVLMSDQLHYQPIVSEHPFSTPQFLALSLFFTISHIINHNILLFLTDSYINCCCFHITLGSHFAMVLDPGAANNPWSNPPPSTKSAQQSHGWNPWSNPPHSNQSTQQSNDWNPWSNPPASNHFTPATAPSSNMSHHNTYQPVTRNPWTNPPAPPSSSNWSNNAVYSPSSAGSVRVHHQPISRRSLNTCTYPLHALPHILLLFNFHHINVCRAS